MECDIRSVCDVAKDGWPVTYSEAEASKLNEDWDATVVAVVGLYNKGKTTVLNIMTGTEFEASNTARTKALSFCF